MNLTKRLFVLVLVALLPAVAILIHDQVVMRREREAEVRQLALRNAQAAASDIERIIEGVRSVLVTIGRVEAVQRLDTAACVPLLAAMKPDLPQLFTIAALDREGRIRCLPTGTPPPGMSFADRPYFRQALTSGGFVLGEHVKGRSSGRDVLPLALALRGPDGAVTGVLVATLDLEWLSMRLRERGVAPGGSITVADRNGVIIAREPLPGRFIGTKIPDTFMHLVTAAVPGTTEVTSQDGTRRMLGYVPASEGPESLYVSIGLSEQESYAVVNRSWRQGLILVGLGVALALLSAWLAGRTFIQKPVGRLLAAANAWRAGRLDVRTGLNESEGELGRVGAAFDAVVAEIGAREAALRDSERRARLAIDAGRMGAWWFDLVGQRIRWSERAAAMIGLPPETTETSFGEWRTLVHPDDLGPMDASLAKAADGDADYEAEFRVVRPDGTQRWVHARGLATFEHGQATRMAGIFLDVTERRQAEQRQQLLIDELNHRVKNTLATVQSIASQTLRSNPDPEAFRERFEARLVSLSATHNLLTQNAWQTTQLRHLLENELSPYQRDGRAFVLLGPPVEVDAATALTLGLVFHELTTNAVKHGALSSPAGQLLVRWSVQPGPGALDPRLLALDWTERGGPPVAPPTRKGFGSRLLERSIGQQLQGEVTMRYEPTGLVCTVRVPLNAGSSLGAPDERYVRESA